MADIKWELRASGSLSDIKELLEKDDTNRIFELHAQTKEDFTKARSETPVRCAGNQHTCMPTVYIPAMQERFDLTFTGTGDSKIVGHNMGPRALVWQNTELICDHPQLGKLKISLEPSEVHAGTLIPVYKNSEMPAINRNTYFFVLELPGIGELISDRPAIVESLITEVPPTTRYEFKNAPLNFYLRSDPNKKVIAIIEKAVTDVKPT